MMLCSPHQENGLDAQYIHQSAHCPHRRHPNPAPAPVAQLHRRRLSHRHRGAGTARAALIALLADVAELSQCCTLATLWNACVRKSFRNHEYYDMLLLLTRSPDEHARCTLTALIAAESIPDRVMF